jgi:hypothetical protein
MYEFKQFMNSCITMTNEFISSCRNIPEAWEARTAIKFRLENFEANKKTPSSPGM